jgi:hypothetical protein
VLRQDKRGAVLCEERYGRCEYDMTFHCTSEFSVYNSNKMENGKTSPTVSAFTEVLTVDDSFLKKFFFCD